MQSTRIKGDLRSLVPPYTQGSSRPIYSFVLTKRPDVQVSQDLSIREPTGTGLDGVRLSLEAKAIVEIRLKKVRAERLPVLVPSIIESSFYCNGSWVRSPPSSITVPSSYPKESRDYSLCFPRLVPLKDISENLSHPSLRPPFLGCHYSRKNSP